MSASGDRCERIRPLIGNLAEGELAPGEAMRVARHLPDCTACRIVAARERRLARMLEEELDDLPVGEEFVRTVMSTLPDGPPPDADLASRRWKARRGLKLAGLFGLLTGAGLTLWHQAALQGGAARPVLPAFSLEQSGSFLQAVATLVGVVLGFAKVTLETLVALAGLTGGWPLDPSGSALALGSVAALAGAVLFALATLSWLVLVGGRLLVRTAGA